MSRNRFYSLPDERLFHLTKIGDILAAPSLKIPQYGPDALRCPACSRWTYGDAEAHFCVHCGEALRQGIRMNPRWW